jgi:hypothetical protein
MKYMAKKQYGEVDLASPKKEHGRQSLGSRTVSGKYTG